MAGPARQPVLWRRAAAAGVVVLLVNLLGIAPALHVHGRCHDARACPICSITVTGVWAPSTAPQVALTPEFVFSQTHLRPEPAKGSVRPTALVRGPPLARMHPQ